MQITPNYISPSLLQQVSSPKVQRAWVVFSGQTDLPWLRLFKKGFRHCYVLINDGEHWISVDPLSCHTEVMVHHIAPAFDLPGWLRSRPVTVVPARIAPQTQSAPWFAHSCVEVVKRILGLHDFWVMTPHQLYKRLTQDRPAVAGGSVPFSGLRAA